MSRSRFLALLAGALFILPGPALAKAELSGQASVIDGDKLVVAGQTIRLHGIDAPEGRQVCTKAGAVWPAGAEARSWLVKHIADRTVRCLADATDRQHRAVATCYIGRENLNEAVVAAGWAFAYARYSRKYLAAEKQAEAAGLGIHAGSCQLPELWRREHP